MVLRLFGVDDKSYHMLRQPVAQMRDLITDALRSSIPVRTSDEVFAKKDDIAKDVNATVSEQMDVYGFTLVSTLITKIALPAEVEDPMNQISAAPVPQPPLVPPVGPRD